MSDKNDFHKKYNDTRKALENALNRLAEKISSDIAGMKSQSERVNYLNNMKEAPSARALKKIYDKTTDC